MADISPVRQQYLEVKRQYPDAILFFRLGDFYETFDADAEIAARELDIVLTSRSVAKGNRVPMAGGGCRLGLCGGGPGRFPRHAFDPRRPAGRPTSGADPARPLRSAAPGIAQ